MTDYFKELYNKLKSENSTIEILESNISECKMEHVFDLFEFGISDEVKYIYNNYKKFLLSWEEETQELYGLVDFIPYDEIRKEHEVFDSGINLHGLVIADSIDSLLENWSKVLFIDIYDWHEGVNEHGIDLSRPVYKENRKWSISSAGLSKEIDYFEQGEVL